MEWFMGHILLIPDVEDSMASQGNSPSIWRIVKSHPSQIFSLKLKVMKYYQIHSMKPSLPWCQNQTIKLPKKSQFLKWTSIKKILNKILANFSSVSSAAQSCPTLCDPMDWSTPGFPVHHQLLELAQTHVHKVSDAIQRSHPLLSPSLPALNLSQNQGLYQWISSLHQVAQVLEFQLQH